MNIQFSHPWYLLLLIPSAFWVIWLTLKSDVHTSRWRRWTAAAVRMMVLLLLVLAMAGLQWRKSSDGMNVYFLLDRSDSIPSHQQEEAREWVNQMAAQKKAVDRAGAILFGADAGIEQSVENSTGILSLEKIQGIVDSSRSDISAGIRLGTAAFPETGQKRLLLLSDGNENVGDALGAIMAARRLGVTMDVIPLGAQRGSDISLQKLGIPNRVKKGQPFDGKIFIHSDVGKTANVRIFRNNELIGEQALELSAGKNLFKIEQVLDEPGFYSYSAQLDVPQDAIQQNNKASAFISVRDEPRILIVSEDPEKDQPLVRALEESNLQVEMRSAALFPDSVMELDSFDTIFLCNVAAGDLGKDRQKILESAVRDFGVGLVCVGGDQAYAAGGYRGTPLENALPVSMELDSKKVLPNGALVLVMHGMEFGGANKAAREIALGTLDALGPLDEMGVLLWEGSDRWLFPLEKVGNKKEMARKIAGMNQGDLPSFEGLMQMGYEGLRKSSANLKHMIVFSDGDPAGPSDRLMKAMVENRITVSAILIAGHAGPETMQSIADRGGGTFYNISSPNDLPQIFIKEAAVILKSAIFEGPFKPQKVIDTEVIRGIAAAEYPTLRGYVSTSMKPRAETPLLTEKGDPLLAHWQYGLGRSVAFTSDARTKWAADWQSWGRYRQFWTQIAQWSLRRLENSDFNTEVTVESGKGQISVEALDEKGGFRNFLTLQATVVSPKGNTENVRLEQVGPGRYEALFATREEGVYTINVLDMENGQPRGSQRVGASINYSPEYNTSDNNMGLLRRLAELGGGRLLDPQDPTQNTFLLNRMKTFQPRDLWFQLLLAAILLFPIDVAIRRIQLDRDEMAKAFAWVRRRLFFWKSGPSISPQEESLSALLRRRDSVRSSQLKPAAPPDADLFRPRKQPVASPIATHSEESESRRAAVVVESEPEPAPTSSRGVSTTSRLLDAKRRAQKKKE